jgi:hypothetical protein
MVPTHRFNSGRFQPLSELKNMEEGTGSSGWVRCDAKKSVVLIECVLQPGTALKAGGEVRIISNIAVWLAMVSIFIRVQ